MMSIFAQALKILHESDLHHEDREIARAAQRYVSALILVRVCTEWLEAQSEQIRQMTEETKRSTEAVDAFNRAYEATHETAKGKEET